MSKPLLFGGVGYFLSNNSLLALKLASCLFPLPTDDLV